MNAALEKELDELTDEQRDAVNEPGNFSLLARPGSGKTRVVGLRLARNAAATRRRIAVASYTNVAVEEVHAVLAKAGVVIGPAHYVGTLHGLLLNYLVRPHGHLVGCGKDGRMRIHTDDWEGKKAGWPRVSLNDEKKPDVPASFFDWTADGSIVCRRRPESYPYAAPEQITELGAANAKKIKSDLLKRGVISQSDAMYVALQLLSMPRLARALAGRFNELIVDEAQDSSDLQIACLRRLHETGALESLVLVADPEQSIYSFQGADPSGCAQLAKDAMLADLELTKNFRSSQLICNTTQHFTQRQKADKAVGGDRDCPIEPELLRFPHKTPGTVIDSFRQRLAHHGLGSSEAIVLTRTRTLRAAVNGAEYVKCNRLIRHLGQLSHARASGRTLRAEQIESAEAIVLWCIHESRHLSDLRHDARRRLRAGVQRLSIELPPTTGTLKEWVQTARPVVKGFLADFVNPGHELSHDPSDYLKSRNGFDAVQASAVFGGTTGDLYVDTVHSVKGRSVDAVLLVVEAPSTKQNPADTIVGLIATPADVKTMETVRIAFVALTRARRYCAIAIADSVSDETASAYESYGFHPAP